ncbi:MAG: DMT family transporter [Pseudomonadales bacterium]
MELWIPITIAAAFLQNVRTALQRHLTGEMSASAATYARFCFAVPFAWLYVFLLIRVGDVALPEVGRSFVLYCIVGGTAQILGTAFLIQLFSYRNFAVGTAYSKTEAVQTAIFGIVILGEPLGLLATLGILVSFVGVVTLSVDRQKGILRSLVSDWLGMPARLGIGSGACFGVAAVCYRGAALSIFSEGYIMAAAYTLAWVTLFQTLAMGLYIARREPVELRRLLRAWPRALWVGVAGMTASAAWFTAMALQKAAYVRALGQVELIFTFIASLVIFRERTNPLEIGGVILIVAGIMLLVQ